MYQTAATARYELSCTVLYKSLNMCLVASITGCQFRDLTGCLILGGAPGSNVGNGAYLGPFTLLRIFLGASTGLQSILLC